MIQPLFPQDDRRPNPRDDNSRPSYRHREADGIAPVSRNLQYSPITHPHRQSTEAERTAAAVELIRHKVEAAYGQEPAVKDEIAEVSHQHGGFSKHQKFMYELSVSGKPLAQIQSEWHNYYVSLPDNEKYEVWQEFYENNQRSPSAYAKHSAERKLPTINVNYAQSAVNHPISQHSSNTSVVEQVLPPSMPPGKSKQSIARLHHRIKHKVKQQVTEKENVKQHLHSLLFGIVSGAIVLSILLFGFFNEMIIAPFIQPSRHVDASQVIVGATNLVAGDTPEVIIPKINVQIPVVYDTNSVNEHVIQDALENGVVHYSTTVVPGEQGNGAIFGHSSNNIFNKGKYKFAFVLLHNLQAGDTFYMTYNKTVYTYKVYEKRIVPPEDISVLNNVEGKKATMALITCDPPGTSTNRLVVWGEQISPDPSTAKEAKNTSTATTGEQSLSKLPSQSRSLWDRLIHWDF